MGFVLQEATCPDMLLTPGEWPTRGGGEGGGLMVSDVLQIGCERLAHTSQEPSRSFTPVTARSCRPPRTQTVAAAARRIFVVGVFLFFSFLSSTSTTRHFILHPPSSLHPPDRASVHLVCHLCSCAPEVFWHALLL